MFCRSSCLWWHVAGILTPSTRFLFQRPRALIFSTVFRFCHSVPFGTRQSLLVGLSWALLTSGVLAQTALPTNDAPLPATTGPSLNLRPSTDLQEKFDANTRKQLPTYLQSDRLQDKTATQTDLDGSVVLRRGDLLLKADQVQYDQVRDQVKATGNVTINRSGYVYQGPALELQLDAFEGFFTSPTFSIPKNKATGQAAKVDFIDNAHFVLHKTSYTSCQRKPGPSWLPDWFFKAEKISVDVDRDVAVAEGATLHFKGLSSPQLPKFDFPISDNRKSGFLPPNIGADNIGGLEYTQPYYQYLAPNRDMTLYPTYWSKRGINLGGEFRYLESMPPHAPFMGEARFNYMQKDLLRDTSRWSINTRHTGLINPLAYGGTMGFAMNLNRVSDQNYWKDFAMINNVGVQRLLSNDATLTWAKGTWTTALRAQKWQTLQDLDNIEGGHITPPFDRVPQLTTRFLKNKVYGLDMVVDGDLTRFESARDFECQRGGNYRFACAPNATRLVSSLQLSRPFLSSASYITPKVIFNSRSYQFDQGLPGNAFYGTHAGETTANVSIPTFSLDTGFNFEKKTHLFKRNWLQTLEPRAFFVYTPHRDQSYLPNYDSGSNAYNFASVFTENVYNGFDRIANNRLLTLGLTSRFLDANTGAEGARLGFAQRVRLQDQRVTLPGEPEYKAGLNDMLFGASLNLTRSWGLDSTIQYNPKTENYLRRSISTRYNPGSYRILNAAYRSQNDVLGANVSQQYEFAWQWPLHDVWRGKDEDLGEGRGLGEGRWYSVARMNYSALDKKLMESVIGFEYDAGCWLGRVVSEQLQVGTGVSRQRLLFQLEFVGFSRLGTNAIGSLRNNVQRYQPLRLPSDTPSRFGHYE